MIQTVPSPPPLNNKKNGPNRNNEESITTSISGMPVLHYYCHRFWSVHRKSLMPIGTSHNRLQRGWMYSKYQDEVARAVDTGHQPNRNRQDSIGILHNIPPTPRTIGR